MLLLIECGLTLAAVVLAFVFPALGSRWFGVLESRFARLASRRGLSVLLVGIIVHTASEILVPEGN